MEQIKRDVYLQRLIDREQNGLVKIVTGIRRCGKSYLLNTLFYEYLKGKGVDDSHIIRISLDDDENEDLCKPKALSRHIKNLMRNSHLNVSCYKICMTCVEAVIGGWLAV